VHGLFDDQPDADRRREVVHHVDAMHELADDRLRQDRIDDEMEARMVAKRVDVPVVARGEVVERPDLPAVGEQELGEVRSDEAGPARYESASRDQAMVARRAEIMGL
jgi:hypothetical protein